MTYTPKDILERLADSSPNESSHELYCRCLDAAEEVSRLRETMRSEQEEFRLLRARVTNLEIALHGLWSILKLRKPFDEQEIMVDEMMSEHFGHMLDMGASGNPHFEQL